MLYVPRFVVFVACLQHVLCWQSAFLDPNDRIELSWDVDDVAAEITFNVSAKTNGWVGVGFTPSGGMKDADIIVMWIADGEVHFSDRHATRQQVPIVDEVQNYELLDASEIGGTTFFSFRRSIDTCDITQDYFIEDGTSQIIYAFGETDPAGNDPSQHLNTNRGVRSVLLLDAPLGDIPVDETVKTIEFRSPSVPVPSTADTTYWCSMHRGPVIDKPHQYIGNKAIVQKGNENIVHHYALYECELNEEHNAEYFEQLLVDYAGGFSCYDPNSPIGALTSCQSLRVVWATGGIGDVYPAEAGYPIHKSTDSPLYYKLEMHYDNAAFEDGIVDSSGVLMYYTDNLRPHDVGILVAAMPVLYAQLIPPGVEEFVSVGHAAPECTAKYIPEEGINVFSILHHSHLAGRRMRTRLFRNGAEEPWLLNDNHYDFNYQQTRLLSEERKLYPGDQITVECYLSTSNRKKATLGGLSTYDEMCESFILYYPAMSLGFGESHPSLEYIHEIFGFENVTMNIDTMEYWVGDQLMEDVLLDFDWGNFDLESYQNRIRYGEHFGICAANVLEAEEGIIVSYPDVEEYQEPPRQC
ncbi:unnamed protein product [Notodromas monacha]|uniref:DOMON domain-containing protein n=1 Tax=Notodromas monacha TaxID=399045 RepID=A0A7R9BP22_9CRUS|nr:unnamed protein product [Notodromas monacha]CAG0917546.1 unnamed protein product [Notodromas monacha]